MEIDISFNKQQAVEAGMQLTKVKPMHTAEELTELNTHDADYSSYRLTTALVGSITMDSTNISFDVDGYAGDVLIVRYNKWQDTMPALTTWLSSKGIAWKEI